ncbi:MAG: ABC transporter permease [Acidobacteria bacterium]|nr:ABC transporter permease [Acidobacteriota bacterium]
MRDWKAKVRLRLANLKLEPTREAAIVEEIAQDLEDCYEELLARGLTEAEARRQALAELSGNELLARELRRVERQVAPEPIFLGTNRRTNMIADLWQDLRFGVQMLRKNPGFTFIAVLTLALGIGANTAMFSIVNAVLLRPVPFPEPERLMLLVDGKGPADFAGADVRDLALQNRSFAQIGAYSTATFNLAGGSAPERVNGARVSAGLLPTLGVQPLYGRNLTAEEDREGGAKVALLGHGVWQRQFGADPNVVGRAIRLDEHSYTVIGVLPPTLNFPSDKELFVPLALSAKELDSYFSPFFITITARLRPGVTRPQADAELSTIIKQIGPGEKGPRFQRLRVMGLQEALLGDARTMMLVLLGAVGFVALIACANLANLLLVAAARRQKEIAVRLSLGASRNRVVRQFLTESLLLAGLGGVAGLLLASGGMTLINALLPSTIPRNGEISVDGRVLAFTFALTGLAGLLFGALPALRASHTALTEALKAGSPTLGGSFGAHRLRASLVVSQVALTVVLLTGAGLLIKSFVRLQQTPLGFRPERLMTARISLPRSAYSTPQQRLVFADRLLEEIRQQPGMQEAALTSFLPFAAGNHMFGVLMNGQKNEERRPGMPAANLRAVSPDYFRVMGIPLLKGREFSGADHQRAPLAAVINETMAKRYWPNADPIGQRINETLNEGTWREIVGIVGSVQHLARGAEPQPEMFVPLSQVPPDTLNIAVRTQVEQAIFASALQGSVTAIDANLPVFEIRTMEQRLFESVAQPRFRTVLLGVFAALALMMAVIGLYAVMAVSVAQRTHELGIRIALGAQRRDVIGLVLRQGIMLVSLGIVIGLAGAWALTRVLTTLLYEVKPTDPLTFVAVPVLLIAVAILACSLPARHAAGVDPLSALRYE